MLNFFNASKLLSSLPIKSLCKDSLQISKGLKLFPSQCYALKYVDPTKYNIDDVKIHKDEDPLAVQVTEKHGKGWHIYNESHNSSVVMTVSGDFDLNKGICREMAIHASDIINQEELEAQKHPLGSVVPLKNGDHFIYFLIIRENWWDRGAYRPMRESLHALRKHVEENNVKTLTMGRLGSQNDGLNFIEVLKDVKKIFYGSGINIIMYARRT